MLQTAQGNELKTCIEKCRNLLEKSYHKILESYGIQVQDPDLIPLGELVQYLSLDGESDKQIFQQYRQNLWDIIQTEVKALEQTIVKKKISKRSSKTLDAIIQSSSIEKKELKGEKKEKSSEFWREAYRQIVDRLVYTFLNRIFALRIMESLDLLKESTFISHPELGNRSARMARIQEKYPAKFQAEWQNLVIQDLFAEISEDISVIFDSHDILTQSWPDGATITELIQLLNAINPEIYQTEDCIGWFYHYYVLKDRQGHKTMSSHGTKSPANPYYLSILNTVYTPRWMVQILVDNSLGHWWQDLHPDSIIFSQSPFFIQKQPVKIPYPSDELTELRILDPACGSGNFLVYTFGKFIEMYKEVYPSWDYPTIITTILTKNLFGIDINRRPAQLSALALFILAKKVLKIKSPADLLTFRMPPVNIISCDIRIPSDKNRIIFIQRFKEPRLQKIMLDVFDQFDNADQLGSLIDIRSLQTELDTMQSELKLKPKKGKLDLYSPKLVLKKSNNIIPTNIVDFVDEELINIDSHNIGLQLFGYQAKIAASLAQVLMQKYDIIMSNPPFGLSLDITKEKLKRFYPDTYADLVSVFIEQALRLLKVNGVISMVSDFSFMHLPKFEKFRESILLTKSFIQYLLVTGLGALPNARNVPTLFILRASNPKSEDVGLYRYVEYSSSQQFTMETYLNNILADIKVINAWNEQSEIPRGWNLISQINFLSLPRCIIDLSLTEKFKTLLEFFSKFPRLDIEQHTLVEMENILDKSKISRVFFGFNTGNNDEFVKYWFEYNIKRIRCAINLHDINELQNYPNQEFVPFSKGGGDIRYYINNSYLFWWEKHSLEKISKYKGSAIRNISFIGTGHLNSPVASGKARCRISISQNGVLNDGTSLGIYVKDDVISIFSLLAYLNSKFGAFFGRLLVKDRKWQAGILARIPIPLKFLLANQIKLKTLAIESFELRRDWDTGYPMSPIFAESLIDKVIENNNTILNFSIPKTGHPFCDEYQPSQYDIAKKINQITVKNTQITINTLLESVEKRFNLLINRLDEIDDEINNILYQLIDKSTAQALDEHYMTYVGDLGWEAERDLWLKDFLMVNLIEIIKKTRKGIITLNQYTDDDSGLYQSFVDLLCKKFNRDQKLLQPILAELRDLLGKDLKHWISDEFFYYHCSRFGGRPIIWQFSSRAKGNRENVLDLFIDYHCITENSLANIRVEYIEPVLKRLEQRRASGTLSLEEIPKCDELEDFISVFQSIETGYKIIPNPNSLTGKNAQKGKGDDKTWEWVFSEASKIIANGYKPDHFKGVLINIIPLCIELPETKKKEYSIDYKALCPKGTLKHILKKIDALDQLRNKGSKEMSEDENEDKKLSSEETKDDNIIEEEEIFSDENSSEGEDE